MHLNVYTLELHLNSGRFTNALYTSYQVIERYLNDLSANGKGSSTVTKYFYLKNYT
jgi:hypothetical protein